MAKWFAVLCLVAFACLAVRVLAEQEPGFVLAGKAVSSCATPGNAKREESLIEGTSEVPTRSFAIVRRSAQISCRGVDCSFGTYSCCYSSPANPCCPYGTDALCCSGGCFDSSYGTCCGSDRACGIGYPVCCGIYCCKSGWTCRSGSCHSSSGDFPMAAIIGIAVGGALLVIGIIIAICCCCCCAAAHASSQGTVITSSQVVPLMQPETTVVQTTYSDYNTSTPAYVSTNPNPYGYQALPNQPVYQAAGAGQYQAHVGYQAY